MLQKRRSSREVGCKVTPPQPVFMSDDQKSHYLFDLRNNRPARPVGSRPLPAKSATAPLPTNGDPPRAESEFTAVRQSVDFATAPSEVHEYPRSASALSFHEQGHSSSLFESSARSRTSIGRPLAVDPAQKSYSIRGRKVSPTAVIAPPSRSSSGNYRESGARWMERQEAVSLREALEEMDHQDEEKRIHAAAQDEAADLVWRHRNPGAAEQEKNAPYANPDIHRGAKHRFTAHLQKGAYSRSQSATGDKERVHLSTSTSRGSSASGSHHSSRSKDTNDATGLDNSDKAHSTPQENPGDRRNSKDIVNSRIESPVSSSRRKSTDHGHTSNDSRKGGFPNHGDQIYEDSGSNSVETEALATEIPTTHGPLKSTNRNPHLRGSRPLPGRPGNNGEDTKKMPDRFEIHKNPPSQSRRAGYTRNPTPPSIAVIPEVETPPSKNGVEIRSEDIRAATSMKLKDRSPKLPCPTAVSDVPGRPIVSFDPSWKRDDASQKGSTDAERPGPRPTSMLPEMTVSAPAVPTINISSSEDSSIPAIVVPESDCTPTITIGTDEPASASVAAQPPTRRPLPQPSMTVPGTVPTMNKSSRLPWLNPKSRSAVPTVTCANCLLPISGRIVTASGAGPSSSSLKARFHPECFTCHHCSTALECVAFYPEPTDKRVKRLEAEGVSSDDAANDLRFYCHLDFHEFFSPRCRSCKTPIEGEVIVAAGAEWHVGHFFCAECGDPFDSNTPFVEKGNYAYCVSCHTRRTSARCRACKKQILDEMTVQALGGQWHADCFNCYECGGGFGDDGRFFVRSVTVEGTEKEKRRGVAQKVEERAVCQACEERRLKA